jgi:prevent-host-death family protein
MLTIASRDLRNHTSEVLSRVRLGERIRITNRGVQVAELQPIEHQRKAPTLTRSQITNHLSRLEHDMELSQLLSELTAATTDEL